MASNFTYLCDFFHRAGIAAPEEPSFAFYDQCKIYTIDNKHTASVEATRRRPGADSVYVLNMGYSPENVKKIAARGQLSKAVVSACKAVQFSKRNAVIINNENFAPNLLNGAPRSLTIKQ